MHILIVTDAWLPQVNGVVRTLDTVIGILRARGHAVDMVTPADFITLPCPTYPEIRLSLATTAMVGRRIEASGPDSIHIATEGPLGLAARRHCMRRGYRFTTSYHTRFPEYLYERLPVRRAREAAHRFLDRFHRSGAAIMVATQSIEDMLRERGHTNIRRWSRGVDTVLFRPQVRRNLNGDRPISLYCGRVATEKNIEAFLDLDLPGTKYVVGDGPQRSGLERRYPKARFTGYHHGESLAALIAQADVFVFPSRTDTFGLVLIEALACGVPVAAYPVPGPRDVVADGVVGALDEDLGAAIRRALHMDRTACRGHAEQYTWERSAGQFLDNLVPVRAY
jgi:glycosyltransferase involved in cell wall biosynthesis